MAKERFVPFQTLLPSKTEWGVLDTKTNKLVETADEIERYPRVWARNRADKLNKDTAK